MDEGDHHVLTLFNDLKNLMDEYGKIINEISSLINNIIMRMIARIDPTPQNKLKVINLPKTNEINTEIDNRINNLKEIKSEILVEIKEIEDVLNNRKVLCPECKGQGEIPKKEYFREEDFIIPEIKYEACRICNGQGFLGISKEILESANETLKCIKKLV